MTQANSFPNSFMQQSERKTSRTPSPRGKSPSGRMSRWPCKGYFKGTCTNSFCEKWHPTEMLVLQDQKWLSVWGKVLVCTSSGPSKKSKNDDKNAVAMLKKKHDLHDRTLQPVVNLDKSHDRTEQPVVDRATRHESNHGPDGVQFIEYTTIGLRLSGHGAAEVEVYLTEELRHATCEIHESYCASY